MPFFKWFGYDQQGKLCSGLLAARNVVAVNALVRAQGIAAETCYELPRWQLGSMSSAQRIEVLEQIGNLLRAGVRLHDALAMIGALQKSLKLRLILEDCVREVCQGHFFYDVARQHPLFFDPVTINLCAAGEHAGQLAEACLLRVKHLRMLVEFQERLRRALIMPVMILGLLCVVLIFFFALVIPRFQQLFAGMRGSLSPMTRALFGASQWLNGGGWSWVASGLGIGVLVILLVLQGSWRSGFIDRMPLVGRLWRDSSRSLFFHTWALLARGGLPVVESIAIAGGVVKKVYAQDVLLFGQAIERGEGLAEACSHTRLFGAQEIETLLAIGESSGELAHVLEHIAHFYQERTYRILHLLSTVIPPMMLLLLGVTIVLLFVALYEPLLTMAVALG